MSLDEVPPNTLQKVIMPVRLSTEKQIREDIKRYTVIARQLDEVNDIPTWRNNISKRKPSAKGKRTHTTPKCRSRLKAHEKLKDKLMSQKPPFVGRVRSSCFNTTKTCTGSLSDRAKSFEQRVAVDSEYCGLIRIVRDNADQIDFGLSQKLLPKNLEKEIQRFRVDYEPEQLTPPKAASFLSSDIDCYFRQVARGFHEFHARDVPLV